MWIVYNNAAINTIASYGVVRSCVFLLSFAQDISPSKDRMSRLFLNCISDSLSTLSYNYWIEQKPLPIIIKTQHP